MKTIAILLLLISSCIPERAARKTNWLKSHGYLSTDTITKRDTIHGFHTDTLVQYSDTTLVDTLYIEKNGVKSQTIIKWKERTVEQTITQRDTIIETKYVKTNQLKCPDPSWWQCNKFWIGFALGFISLWILDRIITKIFGKL